MHARLPLTFIGALTSATACTTEVVLIDDAANSSDPPLAEPDNPVFPGFSWAVPGQVAGMPTPNRLDELDHNLSYLFDVGIRTLVSLTVVPIDPTRVAKHGMTSVHYPVVDFSAPSQEQLQGFILDVDQAHRLGLAVGVHCSLGRGRTGTFLATYFVTQGMTAEEAITHVRFLRPGSIETVAQEDAVREYYDGLIGAK